MCVPYIKTPPSWKSMPSFNGPLIMNIDCHGSQMPDTSMARLGMTLLFWLLGSLIADKTLRAVSAGQVAQAQMESVLSSRPP